MLEKLTKRKLKAAASNSRAQAIRMMCIECFGGESHEVSSCTAPGCPLFPWKSGAKDGEALDKHVRALGG